MIQFPHAKINLGLRILKKRSDDFHDIETVFYPVGWCDVLEVIPAPLEFKSGDTKIEFSVSGNDALSAGDNLCVRAYHLLQKDFEIPPVKAWLHKLIPAGAGLGGGSSDAARMLVMLSKIFDLKVSREKLNNYALQLGSDCPFFIEGKSALATGRGEVLEDIPEVLKNYFICIVKPPFSISTAEAYGMIKPGTSESSLRELIMRPVDEWRDLILNDFETPLAKKYPELNLVKQKFYEAGAVFSLLSGSGSSVYGIFEKQVNGKKIFPGIESWSGKL